MGEEGCFSFAVALDEREKPVETYRKREKDDNIISLLLLIHMSLGFLPAPSWCWQRA